MLFDDQASLHREASITDPLTGLFNRRFFYEQATSVISQANRQDYNLSLMICDLDLFKQVNDSHGHMAGDKVIVAFADLLNASKRQEDILARFGGEEFVLLLPNTTLEGAKRLAERFREAAENSEVIYEGKPIRITASFGVTICNPPSVDNSIRQADEALYKAKALGRNRVVAFVPQQ
ncbi:GGDEF domain-containing protein [Corallincola platygyrae]|uniref:diguanylate cyclase n=2 Tax=Corallincola platygyrae TaxID=1193278 RepID=A0ABW4XPV0_9GAMM